MSVLPACSWAWGVQERASDAQEMEGCERLMLVLGIKPRFSEWTVSALNLYTIFRVSLSLSLSLSLSKETAPGCINYSLLGFCSQGSFGALLPWWHPNLLLPGTTEKKDMGFCSLSVEGHLGVSAFWPLETRAMSPNPWFCFAGSGAPKSMCLPVSHGLSVFLFLFFPKTLLLPQLPPFPLKLA